MEKNIRYEIIKNTAEMKKRKDVEEGCTVNNYSDQFPERIESFDTKEKAFEALKQYKSCVRETETCVSVVYNVTEYYVEENTYDEDGEWISGGDIWEYSKIEWEV